jgi:hypothetical protein
MQSKFEFILFPRKQANTHYQCVTWQELATKMLSNPYLNVVGSGTEILKLYPDTLKRNYKNYTCPISINESVFNPYDNLGHLWLFFGLITPSGGTKLNLQIAETLDPIYSCQNNSRARNTRIIIDQKLFGIHGLCETVMSYFDHFINHTTFVNALFQLELYLKSSLTLVWHYGTRCDYSYFSVASFSFDVSSILYYVTRVSGFQRYSLSNIVEIQNELQKITTSYLDSNSNLDKYILITTNCGSPYYEYMTATGSLEDEILNRNKEVLQSIYAVIP